MGGRMVSAGVSERANQMMVLTTRSLMDSQMASVLRPSSLFMYCHNASRPLERSVHTYLCVGTFPSCLN